MELSTDTSDLRAYSKPPVHREGAVAKNYRQQRIRTIPKSGGLLIFKTYTREQLRLGGGPTHPVHLLESNELLRAFASLRILHYHESIKDKAVAELVARKE